MRVVLIVPLFLLLAVWDLGANHGRWTRLTVTSVNHALRALGLA